MNQVYNMGSKLSRPQQKENETATPFHDLSTDGSETSKTNRNQVNNMGSQASRTRQAEEEPATGLQDYSLIGSEPSDGDSNSSLTTDAVPAEPNIFSAKDETEIEIKRPGSESGKDKMDDKISGCLKVLDKMDEKKSGHDNMDDSSSEKWINDKIQKYKYKMDGDLKFGCKDVIILNSELDLKEVTEFRDILCKIKLGNGENAQVVSYSDITSELHIQQFKALEFALERCTFVFLFITLNFINDKWAEFSSEACLMEAIMNPARRWTVVPVFVHGKDSSSSYTTPFSIKTLKGVHYTPSESFYTDSIKSLLNNRISVRLKNEEQLKEKQYKWVLDREAEDRQAELKRLKMIREEKFNIKAHNNSKKELVAEDKKFPISPCKSATNKMIDEFNEISVESKNKTFSTPQVVEEGKQNCNHVKPNKAAVYLGNVTKNTPDSNSTSTCVQNETATRNGSKSAEQNIANPTRHTTDDNTAVSSDVTVDPESGNSGTGDPDLETDQASFANNNFNHDESRNLGLVEKMDLHGPKYQKKVSNVFPSSEDYRKYISAAVKKTENDPLVAVCGYTTEVLDKHFPGSNRCNLSNPDKSKPTAHDNNPPLPSKAPFQTQRDNSSREVHHHHYHYNEPVTYNIEATNVQIGSQNKIVPEQQGYFDEEKDTYMPEEEFSEEQEDTAESEEEGRVEQNDTVEAEEKRSKQKDNDESGYGIGSYLKTGEKYGDNLSDPDQTAVLKPY